MPDHNKLMLIRAPDLSCTIFIEPYDIILRLRAKQQIFQVVVVVCLFAYLLIRLSVYSVYSVYSSIRLFVCSLYSSICRQDV